VLRGCAPRCATSASTAASIAGGVLAAAQVIQQQCHRGDGGGRVGDTLAGDVGRRAVHRFEHRGERSRRIDVGRRRQPDPAGDRRGQVGDDVAEEVVGDDDVEALRIGAPA
jgi:hypothetical protein